MFVMKSDHKGAIAECAIALAATKLGIPVLTPVAEHGRYDLGFEIGPRILRIQCKWGRLARAGSVIVINLTGSYLGASGYVRSRYREGEIDLVAAYCGELERCYLLPSHLVVDRRAIQLRLDPPKNGQRAGIHYAVDYEFDGAVAQLAERLAGSEEGRGSNPLSSTPSASEPITHTVGSNPFRNHFGYWLERAAAGEDVLVTFHGRPRARLTAEPPLLRSQAVTPEPPLLRSPAVGAGRGPAEPPAEGAEPSAPIGPPAVSGS